MNSKRLRDNVRFYVLLFSVTLSVCIYVYAILHYHGASQTIKLSQYYAFASVTFLYFALLAGPFCYSFSRILAKPFVNQYIKARRAIGVSACYFAFLHAAIALFGQLGGLPGLLDLSGWQQVAIVLSSISLFILFLMAITSFDKAIDKLTFPVWHTLQRFVYLAGILIIIHTLMIGTHFKDLSSAIPIVFFIALSFLFLLESLRFDARIKKKWQQMPKVGISFFLLVLMITYLAFTFIL